MAMIGISFRERSIFTLLASVPVLFALRLCSGQVVTSSSALHCHVAGSPDPTWFCGHQDTCLNTMEHSSVSNSGGECIISYIFDAGGVVSSDFDHLSASQAGPGITEIRASETVFLTSLEIFYNSVTSGAVGSGWGRAKSPFILASDEKICAASVSSSDLELHTTQIKPSITKLTVFTDQTRRGGPFGRWAGAGDCAHPGNGSYLAYFTGSVGEETITKLGLHFMGISLPGPWSEWSTCHVTTLSKTRSRECVTYYACAPANCAEALVESVSCSLDTTTTPGTTTPEAEATTQGVGLSAEWSEWSQCLPVCYTGTPVTGARTRSRPCSGCSRGLETETETPTTCSSVPPCPSCAVGLTDDTIGQLRRINNDGTFTNEAVPNVVGIITAMGMEEESIFGMYVDADKPMELKRENYVPKTLSGIIDAISVGKAETWVTIRDQGVYSVPADLSDPVLEIHDDITLVSYGITHQPTDYYNYIYSDSALYWVEYNKAQLIKFDSSTDTVSTLVADTGPYPTDVLVDAGQSAVNVYWLLLNGGEIRYAPFDGTGSAQVLVAADVPGLGNTRRMAFCSTVKYRGDLDVIYFISETTDKVHRVRASDGARDTLITSAQFTNPATIFRRVE